MITNFLQSRATARGLVGNIAHNSSIQINNTEILEDAAAATGHFDQIKAEQERNEDMALKYVREIKKLAKNKEAIRQLLLKEINRHNINKTITDQISNLISTHMPLMIRAIKERKHFKKMAIDFSLRKQFLEIINSLEEKPKKKQLIFLIKKLNRI